MPVRNANNPKRRIAPQGSFDPDHLVRRPRYLGSPHHKKYPADYGFNPPTAPRPHKSLCDGKRIVTLGEAEVLFRNGMKYGMVSRHEVNGFPKYVWTVDENGDVYEAKLGHDGRSYHGYRLGADDRAMRRQVIKEWKARCRAI